MTSKMWVIWHDYREAYEEAKVVGVYSTRERALEEIAEGNWSDEFSYPEDGFWGTEDISCYLKEFTVDQ